MRKLRKLLGLPGRERWLLVRATALVAGVRAGTWLLPFRVVRRATVWLSKPTGDDGVTTERIAWAVDVAGKYIPDGRNCLVQALSANVLLARRGRSSRLRIGVTKAPSGELKAHAWVESGNAVIIGGSEPAIENFVAFPDFEGEPT
jgi:hypothetical protein